MFFVLCIFIKLVHQTMHAFNTIKFREINFILLSAGVGRCIKYMDASSSQSRPAANFETLTVPFLDLSSISSPSSRLLLFLFQ